MNITHDYTNPKRKWGHDIIYAPFDDEGLRLRARGWGRGLRPGDFIILTNGTGTTCYRIDEVSYYNNPNDMWKAKLAFAPRKRKEEG